MNDFKQNTITTIVEFVQSIPESANEIINAINKIIEDQSEIISIAGNAFTAVRLISSLYKYADVKKSKWFLIGLAKNVNTSIVNENPDYVSDLKKFLSKEKNLMLITNTIEALKRSKSTYVAQIMGFYAGCHLKKLHDVDYVDMLILALLEDFNDFDIEQFCKIFNYLNNLDKKQNAIKNIVRELGDESEFTINKLINHQAIKTFSNQALFGGGTFFSKENRAMPIYPVVSISDATVRFHELIAKCGCEIITHKEIDEHGDLI